MELRKSKPSSQLGISIPGNLIDGPMAISIKRIVEHVADANATCSLNGSGSDLISRGAEGRTEKIYRSQSAGQILRGHLVYLVGNTHTVPLRTHFRCSVRRQGVRNGS